MSSQQVTQQLLMAVFTDDEAANKAARAILQTAKERDVEVNDVAVINHDHDNQIHIKESGEVSGGKGAAVGAVVGGVIGMLAGPLGAVVVGGATGALVGGLTGKFVDSGFSDKRLKEMAEALDPGSSAVLVVVGEKFAPTAETILAAAGGTIEKEMITTEILRRADDIHMSKDLQHEDLSEKDK